MVEGYLSHLLFGLPALLKQQLGPDSEDPTSLYVKSFCSAQLVPISDHCRLKQGIF